jgi:hypothetical protein
MIALSAFRPPWHSMLPLTFLTAAEGIRVRDFAKLKVGTAAAAAGLVAAVMGAFEVNRDVVTVRLL